MDSTPPAVTSPGGTSGSRRATAGVVLLSYLVLTVLFTRPLVRAPATTIEWGGGDPLLVAYILSWGAHGLFREPARVFDAPFLHPTRNTLSLSDHLLSISGPFAPLALLGEPLLFYNVTVFASFFLSAAIFFAYLRRIGCAVFPAWLGGVLFAFTPWRYGQLGHAQLLYTWWIALTLLAMEVWIARPRWAPAIAAGISFALVFEASVYHALFFASFLVAYLPVRLASPTSRGGITAGRALLHAVAALGVAGILLAPSLIAYRRMAAALPPVNRLEELVSRGADLFDYANPSSIPCVWGRFTRFDHPYSDLHWEMHAFPGGLALLAVIGVPVVVLFRRKAGNSPRSVAPALAAGAFLCFLLSLGPVLHVGGRALRVPMPYGFLHGHAPGFRALRVPARASFYVALSGAALAAIGIEMLLRRARGPRVAASIRVAAAAVGLLDVAPTALPYKAPVDYDRLRLAMSATPPLSTSGADLVLPVGAASGYVAPLASAPAFRPLVNGQSGYLPPVNRRIFETLEKNQFGPAQSQVLRLLGVRRLFLDRTHLPAPVESAVLAELTRSGARPRSAGTWADFHVVLIDWPAGGRENR
jgi:hypothetical protein